MVGKLVYSRVLQNRLKKDQATPQISAEAAHQQQFYSSQSEDKPVADSRPRDNYPRDNYPRDNRSRDNRPRNNQQRNSPQRDSQQRDSQQRSSHVRDNQVRDNHARDGYPRESYPQGGNDDRGGDGNKIRRGPGRRIAKEKRMRSMDPALAQKYSSLPESMQEKVNATIEICYQQYMANLYKNPAAVEQEDGHYDNDIQIDTESESL